jgi:hypothetical protein
MKLGAFIALMLFVSTTAHASPSLVEQAAARSRSGDHKAALELYRQAYELESKPSLLVRIAHEHRSSGNAREALAYFCSYMYVDAAGELADEASANARAIAAQLGNRTDSDRDACATKPGSPAKRPAVSSVEVTTELIPQRPPRITKREVVGLSGLAGSVACLGLTLYESRRITNLEEEMAATRVESELSVLADRKSSASLRQKLFLGTAGATMMTGGILYVLGRADRKRAERAYVAPSLIKNGGGMVFGGKF